MQQFMAGLQNRTLFFSLLLDKGVDTPFGVLSPLLHGAASVDNQSDVRDVGFHEGLLSEGPGGPLEKKGNQQV